MDPRVKPGGDHRSLLASCFAFAIPSSGARAGAPTVGKTVTLVVGYAGGGGYDIYARTLARHYGRHIPGNPNVIVQNMPGAASMTSVRYLDATAPKDGTVITTFDPGPDQRRCSPRTSPSSTSPISSGSARSCATSASVTRGRATGIKTFGDMMKRKEFLLIGTTAKGSNADANGAILRNVFKAPIRQIAGYPGSNEQRLALERGELEGNCGSWTAIPQEWLGEPQDQSAVALLGDAPRRHVAGCALRARSRADVGAEGRHRHSQLAGRVGGRSLSPGRCRLSGWRSCARHCRRRSRTRRSWPMPGSRACCSIRSTGEEAEKVTCADLRRRAPELIRKKALAGCCLE